MSQTRNSPSPRVRFHPAAYEFVDQALKFTQRRLGKRSKSKPDDAGSSHISGRELLDGIRQLALKEFGLMTIPVLHHWGVGSTEDFGRIVWDMIERGHMSKTDGDQLSDFDGVYDFDQAFDLDYQFDRVTSFPA